MSMSRLWEVMNSWEEPPPHPHPRPEAPPVLNVHCLPLGRRTGSRLAERACVVGPLLYSSAQSLVETTQSLARLALSTMWKVLW